MQQLIVTGGTPLMGSLTVQGSKNSALPILAASLLARDVVILENCPRITDVDTALTILTSLGCNVLREDHRVTIDSSGPIKTCIPQELCGAMRSSLTFLGALLAREKEAFSYYPGGCKLGARPIDFHLQAFGQLGFLTEETGDRLSIRLAKEHTGGKIRFSYPSVGATENAMLAAVTARGKTTILNAAREPEIRDLADFLNCCGAHIEGAGTEKIVIYGVASLHGCQFKLPQDRIAAATFLSAAAATGGEISLHFKESARLEELLPYYREAGCNVCCLPDEIRLQAPKRLSAIGRIETAPYPGFSTDVQPLFMAMLLKAKGVSLFFETVFENRFAHADGLNQLGGEVSVCSQTALVCGKEELIGSPVEALDLRGGAALLIAACCAKGETVISGTEHIDRGYETIESALQNLGGQIIRR